MRFPCFVAASSALAASASPALAAGPVTSPEPPAAAERLAPALVRLLHEPGRPHPLADASGRIPLSVALPPGADAAALGLLPVAPGIGAIRLVPDDVARFAAAHPGLALGVTPGVRPLLDVSPNWTRVNQVRAEGAFAAAHPHLSSGNRPQLDVSPSWARVNQVGDAYAEIDGKGVLVGIIDTGLDVHHPDLRTRDGHTRVAWMLTPGQPKGLHPDLEDRFGCTSPKQAPCAIYAAADIDAVIKSGRDELGDSEGHGTHVASIAAGNGGPSQRFVGLAPGATLIVAAPPPESGGVYDTDILNAARFVFDRADAMHRPVAVNISLGTDYGAHDGSSALEKGLSGYVGDQHPGRAIVVAAGNSGELVDPGDGSGPFGIHTEAHVTTGEVVRVPIVAGRAMNGQGFVWVTFRPGDDVDVGLEGPGRSTWVGLTGKGSQGAYQDGSGGGENHGGVVNNLPSGSPDLTADTNSAVVLFSGHWDDLSKFAVLLRGSGDASLWVTGRQDAAGGLLFERALRQGTVNVPATAPGLLAVGCTINRVKWTPLTGGPVALDAFGSDKAPLADGACYFSSTGPTPAGVQKPEISAPGALVGAAMSADADPRQTPGGLFDISGCPAGEPHCAVLDDTHALAAGTSMSAPHVAGAIALLMQVDPTLTQARVTDVLQSGARLSHGHVPDPDQLGPGSLDVAGAYRALQDDMTAASDADPRKSWYTLSSDYARPDATWPVWGTIALRRSDGTAAGGKPTLTSQGGTPYQPLTRVRQGLWRFAVAGRDSDRGGSITLDVTYAGVSLGTRTLRVGTDTWTAADPSVGAVGGACAFAADGSADPRRWPALLLALLPALARSTRRRRQFGGLPPS